jgi:hypothetical protein
MSSITGLLTAAEPSQTLLAIVDSFSKEGKFGDLVHGADLNFKTLSSRESVSIELNYVKVSGERVYEVNIIEDGGVIGNVLQTVRFWNIFLDARPHICIFLTLVSLIQAVYRIFLDGISARRLVTS